MNRREFAVLFGGVLAAPLSRAQTADRVIRVGFIFMGALRGRSDSIVRDYEEAMRQRGYVEGRNVVTEWRTAEGKLERIPEIAAELVQLKPDVIVVPIVNMAQYAAKATGTVPIFSMSGDPLMLNGLIQSYNRPSGNVNGVFASGTITIEQKRLELLRILVPKLQRVAFVATTAWWGGQWGNAMRDAAQTLGLQAEYIESHTTGFAEAFAEIRRRKPEAVFFESSPIAFNQRASIGEFALASGIPSACGHAEIVEAGCLMTYNFTIAESLRVLADFVDRIAKGAKAGEIPYQQHTRYELTVNAKTAKTIGLAIPQAVLLRADRVIE